MIDFRLRIFRPSRCLPAVALLATLAAQPAAHAQTESDRALIAKARSHYLLGPVPGNISCDVQLDWDRFFAAMKLEQTDAVKARMESFKKLQIAVVSKDAAHTDVNISGTDSITTPASQGLQQQLQGFFQIYWSTVYGTTLPMPKDKFRLTSNAAGYTVETDSGASTSSTHMDPSFAADHSIFDSPQMKAEITYKFSPGDDNLLRLRRVHEIITIGTSRMEIEVNVDYQAAGKYEVPQHIDMTIPGAYSFHYLLTNCKVDPAASEQTPAPGITKN